MEESDVLQHLLHVENEAASLASDAQAEADRRVSERERRARESYSAAYGSRVAELEAEYQREAASIDAGHRRILEQYREELDRRHTDESRFSSLVHALLFEDD
jgi:hypothetical protein